MQILGHFRHNATQNLLWNILANLKFITHVKKKQSNVPKVSTWLHTLLLNFNE